MQLAEAKKLREEAAECGEYLFWPYLCGPIDIAHKIRFDEICARFPLTTS